MNGAQHKIMGIGAGVGLAIYSLTQPVPDAYKLVSVPFIVFGSLFPDIDHDKTKLGSTRKKMTTTVKFLISISSVIYLAVNAYSSGLAKTLFIGLWLLALFIGLRIFLNNKTVKKQTAFLCKNRGIMHTAILPAQFILFYVLLDIAIFKSIFFGLALGMFVHLLGDGATVKGVPLLWPITKYNIKYLSLESKKHEHILSFVSYIWCILFILIGLYKGLGDEVIHGILF